VDAFTDRPFGGNPAAVCWLEREADAGWMQQVAAEMNLSETAFVRPLAEGLELRWFTPAVEVDLCGHATLATAHALWTEGRAPADRPLRFHTRSGVLTCTRDGEFIELDFPATPAETVEPPTALLAGLGTPPALAGRSRFDYLAVYREPAEVRALRPDYARLRELPVRGVIATAAADRQGFDFISRFFAPACGVEEDPVCGSAHCCLGPYWAARLGKSELMALQVSPRGGVLRVRMAGDRTMLGGRAVTIWRGSLLHGPD
jgi:predicted PhzF superfamily epimerase YddE/YHI9